MSNNQDLSPLENPSSYPGKLLPSSCVATAGDIYPMRLSRTDDDWPLRSWWGVDFEDERRDVDTVLDVLGATLMDDRQPVLAIGSNGSAAQIRKKFRDIDVWAVPVTVADVTGVHTGFSPHISKAGYMPWVPISVVGDDQARQFRVLWLTKREMQILDSTEPNYTRTALPVHHTVRLESGQALDGVELYRGRWGVLASAGQPALADTQRHAMQLLNKMLNERSAVTHEDLATSVEQRDRVSQMMKSHSVPDGFEDEQITPNPTEPPSTATMA